MPLPPEVRWPRHAAGLRGPAARQVPYPPRAMKFQRVQLHPTPRDWPWPRLLLLLARDFLSYRNIPGLERSGTFLPSREEEHPRAAKRASLPFCGSDYRLLSLKGEDSLESCPEPGVGMYSGAFKILVISKQSYYALGLMCSPFCWAACGCHGYGFVFGGL